MNIAEVSVDMDDYPFEIRPLTEEEGGGYLITFPDLPGCMSDGETIAEAIENGRDAFKCWMATLIEDNRPIPQPGEARRERLPKSLHARLQARAAEEGVSLETLVAACLAEALGKREGREAG
jgi:antitoxin HicB